MIVTLATLLLIAPQYARTPYSSGGAAETTVDRQRQEMMDHSKGKVPTPSSLPGPIFLTTPTAADVQAAYPAAAKAAKQAGEVILRCKVDKAGKFTDCKVNGEAPKKSGFGDAALALSKVFLLDTKATDGTSMVGRNVTIPMRFTPQS